MVMLLMKIKMNMKMKKAMYIVFVAKNAEKYMQLNIQAMTAKLNVHIAVQDLFGQNGFLNTVIYNHAYAR